MGVTRIVWTGDERLRLCARQIRRAAKEKAEAERGNRDIKPLQWIQVDAREELARIIGAEVKRKVEDAPPERDE
jgi:hypothetical protein